MAFRAHFILEQNITFVKKKNEGFCVLFLKTSLLYGMWKVKKSFLYYISSTISRGQSNHWIDKC